MELFIMFVSAVCFGVIAYRFEQMRADIKYMKKQIKTLSSITSMESNAIDSIYEVLDDLFDGEDEEDFSCCKNEFLDMPKKPLTKGKK